MLRRMCQERTYFGMFVWWWTFCKALLSIFIDEWSNSVAVSMASDTKFELLHPSDEAMITSSFFRLLVNKRTSSSQTGWLAESSVGSQNLYHGTVLASSHWSGRPLSMHLRRKIRWCSMKILIVTYFLQQARTISSTQNNWSFSEIFGWEQCMNTFTRLWEPSFRTRVDGNTTQLFGPIGDWGSEETRSVLID